MQFSKDVMLLSSSVKKFKEEILLQLKICIQAKHLGEV